MKKILLAILLIVFMSNYSAANENNPFPTNNNGVIYKTINGTTYIYDETTRKKIGSMKQNTDGTSIIYDNNGNELSKIKIGQDGDFEIDLNIPELEKFKIKSNLKQKDPYSTIELSDGYTEAQIKNTGDRYEAQFSNPEESGALDADIKENSLPKIYGYDNKDRKGQNLLEMFNFITNPMNNAK